MTVLEPFNFSESWYLVSKLSSFYSCKFKTSVDKVAIDILVL